MALSATSLSLKGYKQINKHSLFPSKPFRRKVCTKDASAVGLHE